MTATHDQIAPGNSRAILRLYGSAGVVEWLILACHLIADAVQSASASSSSSSSSSSGGNVSGN